MAQLRDVFDDFVIDGREVTITATYSVGRPGKMYLKNGDQGYPDEPPEVEVESIRDNETDDLIDFDTMVSCQRDDIERDLMLRFQEQG